MKHLEKKVGIESKAVEWLDPWDVGFLAGWTREAARNFIEYFIRNAFKSVRDGENYGGWFDDFTDGLVAELKAAEKSHSSPIYKAHVLVTHSCNAMATKAVINGNEPKFHSEQGEKPSGLIKLSKKAGKWRMADVDLSGPGSR